MSPPRPLGVSQAMSLENLITLGNAVHALKNAVIEEPRWLEANIAEKRWKIWTMEQHLHRENAELCRMLTERKNLLSREKQAADVIDQMGGRDEAAKHLGKGVHAVFDMVDELQQSRSSEP